MFAVSTSLLGVDSSVSMLSLYTFSCACACACVEGVLESRPFVIPRLAFAREHFLLDARVRQTLDPSSLHLLAQGISYSEARLQLQERAQYGDDGLEHEEGADSQDESDDGEQQTDDESPDKVQHMTPTIPDWHLVLVATTSTFCRGTERHCSCGTGLLAELFCSLMSIDQITRLSHPNATRLCIPCVY